MTRGGGGEPPPSLRLRRRSGDFGKTFAAVARVTTSTTKTKVTYLPRRNRTLIRQAKTVAVAVGRGRGRSQ